MRTAIVLLMFINAYSVAQDNYRPLKSYLGDYLSFISSDNNIVMVLRDEFTNPDESDFLSNYSLVIFSAKDGSVLEKIPILQNVWLLYGISISHDGSYCVTLSKDKFPGKKDINKNMELGPFTLLQYSLKDNKCMWSRQWPSDYRSLDITYSKDNSQIIAASVQNTIIIESETGKLIRKSNNIAGINDFGEIMRYDLSENGKYFAFWTKKYIEWSRGDESMIITLLDYSWYGLRWLYHFGSIPNYLYVWDVQNDSLYCKIAIPYETVRGMPVFSFDEDELLIESGDFKYKEYSLIDKKVLREFEPPDSTFPDRSVYHGSDYKIISPDKKYFMETYSEYILLIDRTEYKLVDKSIMSLGPTYPFDRYAMAFSSDSKYFAIVTCSNVDTVKYADITYTVRKAGKKLNLYETGTRKKIWETEYKPETK